MSLVFSFVAQRAEILAFLSFEAKEAKYVVSSSGRNANILAPGPIKKDILLSQSLQVEEEKSVLFFIHGPAAEIWPFYLLKLRK